MKRNDMKTILGGVVAMLVAAGTLSAAEGQTFKPTKDHEVQAGVPQGKVVQMPAWESKIFPNTTRDWWIYVPAQYKPDGSAAVMVFQDGRNYINATGNFRAPTVFDNLIARGEMPVTLGVFVMPGHGKDAPAPKKGSSASNRGFEYDSMGDRYARFIIEEILPEVAKQYPFAKDPEKRAIAGSSSGGIAAFTVAWERPDQFRKVISHIGSFTNIQGGHVYPALVRKSKAAPKPLRVFLQEGHADPDNLHGNWPLANRDMAAALKFAGYDHRLVLGDGGHSAQHGGAILADTLRWLWRDWPQP